jgi:peroxiredoxin
MRRSQNVSPLYSVFTIPSDKAMYGKTYLGNERTTFIVDAGGDVAAVLRKVKPAEHDELVLRALAEVSPPVG